jgi:hypothetical protein
MILPWAVLEHLRRRKYTNKNKQKRPEFLSEKDKINRSSIVGWSELSFAPVYYCT